MVGERQDGVVPAGLDAGVGHDLSGIEQDLSLLGTPLEHPTVEPEGLNAADRALKSARDQAENMIVRDRPKPRRVW